MKTDLERIIELDEKDIAASKTQDTQGLLDLWDPEGIAIPPDQDPVVGIEQIATWLNQPDEAEYEVTQYEHNFEERKILEGWAFEWGSYLSAAVPLDGGAPTEASGKLLRILKRQPDGEWKVARAIWNVDPAQKLVARL